MRGIEIMLLAAFAGLVGLGLWNARQWLPQWSPKAVSSAPANAGKTTEKVAGKREGNKQHSGKRGVKGYTNSPGTSTLAEGNLPRSETTVEVPAAIPTQADLPVGVSGVRIVAKYGEPTARVAEMHGGQLLERYYYFSSDRTQLTVATLVGGVITGAEAYRADRAASR